MATAWTHKPHQRRDPWTTAQSPPCTHTTSHIQPPGTYRAIPTQTARSMARDAISTLGNITTRVDATAAEHPRWNSDRFHAARRLAAGPHHLAIMTGGAVSAARFGIMEIRNVPAALQNHSTQTIHGSNAPDAKQQALQTSSDHQLWTCRGNPPPRQPPTGQLQRRLGWPTTAKTTEERDYNQIVSSTYGSYRQQRTCCMI